MKIGRKGFTLVEIIVSLAIMTIVAGSVGAFIIAGNNSYLRGNKELTLQEEAQLTANQMIDLIIDVEKAISFTGLEDQTAYSIDGSVAKDAAGNEVNDASVAELRLINNDNSYMIRWQGSAGAEYDDANQVYLYEAVNTRDADGNVVPGDFSTVKPALMAEHVSNFNVDLSGLDKRKVILNMTFTYQDKSYDISETVRLRNDLSAEESKAYSWITGLKITPENPVLSQGDIQVFSYELTGDADAVTEAKKNGVTWTVTKKDGTACKSAFDNKGNGALTVDGAEDCGTEVLKVVCTLNGYANITASTYVSVQERNVDSITITPKNLEAERGKSYEFTCELVGSEAAVKKGVDWSVTYADGSAIPAENGTSVKGKVVDGEFRGTLTVGANEKMGVGVLRVTCTSVADKSMSDSASVTVAVVKGQYTVELIPRILTTYKFTESGQEKIGYCVTIECLPSWANYDTYPKISWRVVSGSNGYTFGEADEKSRYKQVLYCSNNLNTTVTVEAEVYLDENIVVTPTIDIQIPNLKSAITSDVPYIDSDQFVLYRNGKVTCTLKNYDGNMNEVTWRFANEVEEGLAPTKEEEEGELKPWEGVAQAKRFIGFSKLSGGSESFPEGWDGTNYTKWLYSSATGQTINIWAKHTIQWNKEYRMMLEAVDKNGNVIADTCIFIPKVIPLFPDEKRYVELVQKDQYNGEPYKPLNIKFYGYAQGTGAGEGLTSQMAGLNMTAKISGNTSKETQALVDGIYLGANEGVVPIKISPDEKAQYLYLSFYDKDHPEDDTYAMERVLVIRWKSWSEQNEK